MTTTDNDTALYEAAKAAKIAKAAWETAKDAERIAWEAYEDARDAWDTATEGKKD